MNDVEACVFGGLCTVRIQLNRVEFCTRIGCYGLERGAGAGARIERICELLWERQPRANAGAMLDGQREVAQLFSAF
jgi:hypothetical protein